MIGGLGPSLLHDKTFPFAVGALLLILLFTGWDFYESRALTQGVHRTDSILRDVDALLSSLKDAETGQRGYLLTKSDSYLAPYEQARIAIPGDLKRLRSELVNELDLHTDLNDITEAVDGKMEELQQTIQLRRDKSFEDALAVVQSNEGQQLMRMLRDRSQDLKSRLTNRLDDRNRRAANRSLAVRILTAGSSCFLLGLVALATLRFKKEKEAADEANQAKSAFLANMSHELRTPLNAIIGYSEMVLEEAEDTGETAVLADVQKIRTAGKHLLELINAVLDLSKIEAGKMELYLETFEIGKVVEEVVAVIQPMAEKNENTLRVSIADGIDSMRADQTKLRQTLNNLVSNANKFTSKGHVDLNVSQAGEMVVFEVKDSGVGMTPAQIEKLFNPFTQADSSTSRKYGGTGLGLTISRRFAQMMGGDIKVASESGAGSTFTLELPRYPAAVKAAPQAQARKARSGQGDLVLIIDDDPGVHDLLRRTLSKLGFHVESAMSGEEGMRLARKLRPQIITLDVMMPGMDGWTVLSSLKADPDLADIPVVMLTIVDNKNLGYSLGAADYLTKPIERERLAAVLLRYRSQSANSALVVEDDADSRDVISRLLASEGWTVHEAENGIEGLESLRKHRAGVILLDLMMPEMDGFQFLSELQKHDEWKSIPVVVITAKDLTAEDRVRLNGHVSKVLQKSSYSRDQLLDEVSRLVVARIRPGHQNV